MIEPDREFVALQITENIGLEGLGVTKMKIPNLKPGQCLVKVDYANVNPADIASTQGNYLDSKPVPFSIGVEGSGTVVQTSSYQGWLFLKNKRVMFAQDPRNQNSGSWGQQCITNEFQVWPIPDAIDSKIASCAMSNPGTCWSLFKITAEKFNNSPKGRVVVQTAAAGALGKMIDKQFRMNGVKVINIVRKDTQMEILSKNGGDLTLQLNLNSSVENFETTLKSELVAYEKTSIVFLDAVAGEVASQVFKNLPKKSCMISYGALSGKNYDISQKDTIFKQKSVEGFHLSLHLRDKGTLQSMSMLRAVVGLLPTIFKSDIAQIIEVNENTDKKQVVEAIRNQKQNMTDGKLLFKF